jgi:serralysin
MATIYGTNGYDKIVQNNYSAVYIYAYDGDDDIYLNRTDSLGGNNYVSAGYGDDYVLNYFEGGNDIFLGYGDDFYKATIRGRASGEFDIVAGGAGNDRFEVNSFVSVYKGESGNDTFLSVGFNNTFDGGVGVDTISFILQDNVSGERGRGVTVDLAAQKASTATGRLEDLISIENAIGTQLGDDDITGSAGANVLQGLGGDDILDGLGSNDILYGGSGDDDLYGGSGHDILNGGTGFDYLYGGSGEDTFVYKAIGESAVGASRDVIFDFKRLEYDVVDLRSIDANEFSAGNQAFRFIGSASFDGTAGQVRFASGVISGDTDGDGLSDFQIKMNGVTTMYSDDFFL